MESNLKHLKLAFVPGTGKMGHGLARIYAKAGYQTFVGSRSLESATKTAEELKKELGNVHVVAATNADAAAQADVIFWGIQAPLNERHEHLRALKSHLKGKIVVDLTNIGYLIDESQWGQVSSVEQNVAALGLGTEEVKWTHAYKSTFEKNLFSPTDSHGNKRVILIGGDDKEAVNTLAGLIESTDYAVTRTGGIKSSRIVELLGPKWIGELESLNGTSEERGYWVYVKH